jgi:hypothetical protein
MPPIGASARVNTEGWKQVTAAPQQPQKPAPGVELDPTARSSFMQASMPLMASTGDAFARQFYTQNGLPQQRILPAKRGSGA